MDGGITFLWLLEGEWNGPHVEYSAKCFPYLQQSAWHWDKAANIRIHPLMHYIALQ